MARKSAAHGTADVDAFTSAGQPFELIDATVRGASCRVFRHAPRSLAQLYRAARRDDERVLAVAGGARLTYGAVFAQAAALAADLGAHGAVRGTHVALVMANRPEWLAAFIAISALGAVPVLINSRGAAGELAASLRHTRTWHVVADSQRARLIAATAEGGLSGVVVGDDAGLGSEWRDYDEIILAGRGLPLPAVDCAPEEPALIMFTSGTTGEPNAAVLNHIGILTALMANQLSAAMLAAQLAAARGVDVATLAGAAPQRCTLLALTFFHTSGCLSVFLTNLTRGGKIVFLPRWSAAEALQLVQQERVTSLPAVPTMLWDLLHAPELTRCDTSSLLNLGTGGQALPVNLLRAIHDRFPTAVLGTGYGMTETNGMVSLLVGDEYLAHPESAGRALPTVQLRIVDDQGAELPRAAIGEVCIRSAQNMIGYWDRPQASAERLRQGWLHSGDLGRVDAHGLLQIVGRNTDMVISGGENIYCAEVERVLTQHPQAREAAAFGVPDERLGEKLVVVIVPHAGVQLELAELREFCAQRLAAYKLPREWRVDPGPLERNATGKVLKARLRSRLWGRAGWDRR